MKCINNFLNNLKIKRRTISALAALHIYGNPSSKLKIIGVTGTNGKTTTTTLLYKVATSLGYKAGLIGTVENIIVDEIRPALRTTPGPIPLNLLLKEMVEKGCEYVFMEISSHAMDQKRVVGITFKGGVFTNLTHDHLDYHKNMDNYFLAKKSFFEMLGNRSFALSNADDDFGRKILNNIKATSFLYGFKHKAEFEGKIVGLDFSGLDLRFNDIQVKSNLLGKFNAYNLLSVWSTCSLLGFDMQKVNKILEKIEPPRGRFDYFISKLGILGIVDFAHTPDAIENILSSVNEIKKTESKVIIVFGCGGDRDPLKRRIMGKIGAMMSDIAIFTSDNPRSENPEKIISDMKTDLSEDMLEKVKFIVDRRDAIKEAFKLAKPGDIILCAGKGHENYQEIMGIKYDFNDLQELKKVLNLE